MKENKNTSRTHKLSCNYIFHVLCSQSRSRKQAYNSDKI